MAKESHDPNWIYCDSLPYEPRYLPLNHALLRFHFEPESSFARCLFFYKGKQARKGSFLACSREFPLLSKRRSR